MEIARRCGLPPVRILLDSTERVIYTLSYTLERLSIGWKDSSEIENIIVVWDIILCSRPYLFPVGSELYIILENEIVGNIRPLICQLGPESEMTKGATGHCLFPEKVIRLEDTSCGRTELQGPPINR
jgi:hypothetical protein